jgi:flagellar FliL protein
MAMAEHAASEAAEQQPPKKRSLVKLLFLALNVLVFLTGVGALAWSKFGPQPQATATQEHHEAAEKPDAAHAPAAKGHDAPAPAKGGHGEAAKGHGATAKGHGGDAAKGHGSKGSDSLLVPLNPFIVNLSGDQGQRYLRLAVQVEVREDLAGAAKTALEKHLPEVRDRLIFLLTSKTFADIGSIQGKYDLQADITRHINETLEAPFIRKTYFTEFIVQ